MATLYTTADLQHFGPFQTLSYVTRYGGGCIQCFPNLPLAVKEMRKRYIKANLNASGAWGSTPMFKANAVMQSSRPHCHLVRHSMRLLPRIGAPNFSTLRQLLCTPSRRAFVSYQQHSSSCALLLQLNALPAAKAFGNPLDGLGLTRDLQVMLSTINSSSSRSAAGTSCVVTYVTGVNEIPMRR
jgi:hypothetical protein